MGSCWTEHFSTGSTTLMRNFFWPGRLKRVLDAKYRTIGVS